MTVRHLKGHMRWVNYGAS